MSSGYSALVRVNLLFGFTVLSGVAICFFFWSGRVFLSSGVDCSHLPLEEASREYSRGVSQ